MVDRSQEVFCAANPFDRIFAAFVGGPDIPSGFDPAAGPYVENARGQWSRPGCTVPAGPLAFPAPVLGEYSILGRATKLASHDYQDAFVQAASIDVLDQCRDRLVIRGCADRMASKM